MVGQGPCRSGAAVAVCAALCSAAGCYSFVESGGHLGVDGSGFVYGLTVPIPMTPRPFDYPGAASQSEVKLAAFTFRLVQVGEDESFTFIGLGAGRAKRVDPEGPWRYLAFGAGSLEYEQGWTSDKTLGFFADIGVYRMRPGGVKVRIMLAPSVGVQDHNLSGVSVSYWWGYGPAVALCDFVDKINPYGAH